MKIVNDRIALISDIHIGAHVNSPLWHTISLDFARWLRDELFKQDIKDIFILGDINDDRNEISVTSLHILPQFFDILKEFNIIAFPGNHDSYYNNRCDVHSLGTIANWNNITLLDKPTQIQHKNKKLMFCPWGTTFEQILESDIVFGHFEITSFKITQGMVCDAGLSPKDILSKAPLTISGHFHIPEIRKYQNGRIVYLGCPYQLNWGDYLNQKGYHLLDLTTDVLSFIPNNISPKFIKILYSEIVSGGGWTNEIKEKFKGNIVQFIFDVQVDEPIMEKLSEKLLLLQPLKLNIEYFDKDPSISVQESTKFEGVNIEGSLIEFIKQLENVDNKEEVVKYILDVFSRSKLKTEQNAIINEDSNTEE